MLGEISVFIVFDRNHGGLPSGSKRAVQMRDHIAVLQHGSGSGQGLQSPLRQFLIALPFLERKNRIKNAAVEHAGRNRMQAVPAQKLPGRVHIQSQLQLQAVIDLLRIELRASRLIVHDFDIGHVSVPADVDPVNPPRQLHPVPVRQHDIERREILSAAEILFGAVDHEIAGLQLLRHRPGRRVHEASHPGNAVLVPGG